MIAGFKRAFSLLEVNLAILVMGGGIVSIAALYTFGFREVSQSREDVASAAYADLVLGPLTMALSDTNITWEAFNSIKSMPGENGWGDYFDTSRPGEIMHYPQNRAAQVYGQVIGKLSASGISGTLPPLPKSLGACGLVVIHAPNSPIVHLAFRASQEERTMLTAPLYYTAVAFQGVQQELGEEDER